MFFARPSATGFTHRASLSESSSLGWGTPFISHSGRPGCSWGGESQICYTFGYYKEPNGHRFATHPPGTASEAFVSPGWVAGWVAGRHLDLAFFHKFAFPSRNKVGRSFGKVGRSLGFPFKTNEILNISLVWFKHGFQGKSSVPLPPHG